MTSVLLVDDDDVFAQVLARSLGKRGYQVRYATSGTEALTIAAEQQPNAVLLDLKLEQESGLDFIQPLRQAVPDTRLILITGFASIATAVQAIKLGADDYLAKPIRIEQVIAAIHDQSTAGEIPETPLSPKRLEWEHIQRVLAENQGNISATARALGMHRRTLQRKLQKKPVKD